MIIVCLSKSGYTHHGHYYYYGELVQVDKIVPPFYNLAYWRLARGLERDLYYMGIRSMAELTKF